MSREENQRRNRRLLLHLQNQSRLNRTQIRGDILIPAERSLRIWLQILERHWRISCEDGLWIAKKCIACLSMGNAPPDTPLFDLIDKLDAAKKAPSAPVLQIVHAYTDDVRTAVLAKLNEQDRMYMGMRDSALFEKVFTVWQRNVQREKVKPALDYFVNFIHVRMGQIQEYVRNGMRGAIDVYLPPVEPVEKRPRFERRRVKAVEFKAG